jgi:nickel-dependent lactate racemase
MLIRLAYGNESVPIDVPDNWINGRCYRPHAPAPCADVRAELMATISGLNAEQSISAISEGKGTCVVVVDPESPVIMREVLPALIELIEDESALSSSDIHILVANRSIKPLRPADLTRLIPSEITNHYAVTLHDPRDTDNMVLLGDSSRQVPITVNRIYREAEFKVILGGVRPDMLTGFTGGRAVIMPGIAGELTLQRMYDVQHVTDRNARYGSFRDNPFHMTGVEATNMAGCDLAVNVTLTQGGDVLRIFAGHFGQSHLLAMNSLRESMSVKVKEPMDIVVTSAGGHPWDNGFAGLVTTLCAVEPVLKPEGTIVVAARLANLQDASGLDRYFLNNNTAAEAMERLTNGDGAPGRWIAQRFYSILQTHEVIIYNRDVGEDLLWSTGLTPSADMTQAVHEAMQSHGQRCKIVALPDGPLGIGEIGAR